MPRMQVYLPDDLYELVKTRGLPASELLQKAVRAEGRRLDLLAEADRYLAELVVLTGARIRGNSVKFAGEGASAFGEVHR
jgi:hypothetical protein